MASLPKNLTTTPQNTIPPMFGSSPPVKKHTRFSNPSATTAASSARLSHITQPAPSTTTDPFSLLSLHIVSEIIHYLHPLDIIAHQRVSKAWRVILASEYIYTISLRAHFPFSPEAGKVWKLHRSGERFPAAAVEAYRSAAYRSSRKAVSSSTLRPQKSGGGNGLWALQGGWFVFLEAMHMHEKNRVGVQRLGESAGGRRWINFGKVTVRDLAVGSGCLRVTGQGWTELYELRRLSRRWRIQVPREAVLLNIADDVTGYVTSEELHLISLETGETIKKIALDLPTTTMWCYITPSGDFVIIAIAGEPGVRVYSTSGLPAKTITIPGTLQKPTIRFSSVTNTLHVSGDSTAWRIAIKDWSVVETISYPLGRWHGEAVAGVELLFPSDTSLGVYIARQRGLEVGVTEHSLHNDQGRAVMKMHESSHRSVGLLSGDRRVRTGDDGNGLWIVNEVRCDDGDERWVVVRGRDDKGPMWVVMDFGSDVGV
ncbi:hypothetical protein K440DRAFT_618460 [Wilcoxina mikolae CBS 423.85]|nr:hypothetical protein K440DRAFT_618460 [Wilcoxina mikolae CBS 423.85]